MTPKMNGGNQATNWHMKSKAESKDQSDISWPGGGGGGRGDTQVIQPRNKCKVKTEGLADLTDIFPTVTQFMKLEDMTTQFWFGLDLSRIFFKRHIHTHTNHKI